MKEIILYSIYMFSIIFLYIIIYINTNGSVLYYKNTHLIFLIEKNLHINYMYYYIIFIWWCFKSFLGIFWFWDFEINLIDYVCLMLIIVNDILKKGIFYSCIYNRVNRRIISNDSIYESRNKSCLPTGAK